MTDCMVARGRVLAARADGKLYVAARDGRIWLVDPQAGWNATLGAQKLFGDELDALILDVRVQKSF